MSKIYNTRTEKEPASVLLFVGFLVPDSTAKKACSWLESICNIPAGKKGFTFYRSEFTTCFVSPKRLSVSDRKSCKWFLEGMILGMID